MTSPYSNRRRARNATCESNPLDGSSCSFVARWRSIGQSGPEMPPSFLIRQKWTARKMAVSNGSTMMWST